LTPPLDPPALRNGTGGGSHRQSPAIIATARRKGGALKLFGMLALGDKRDLILTPTPPPPGRTQRPRGALSSPAKPRKYSAARADRIAGERAALRPRARERQEWPQPSRAKVENGRRCFLPIPCRGALALSPWTAGPKAKPGQGLLTLRSVPLPSFVRKCLQSFSTGLPTG
jgi:hypothetical protein